MSDPKNTAKPPDSSSSERPLRTTWPYFGIGAMVLALLMLPFTNVTYWPLFHFAERFPGHYITAAKQFANPFTVTVIFLSIGILDKRRRPVLVALLAAILLASTVNSTLKTITVRARPRFSLHLDAGSENTQWIKDYNADHPKAPPIPTDPTDTWLWFSPHRLDLMASSKFGSFPSGHSCGAFVMAAFLVALYPQGRWLWLVVAVGCAIARVAQRRHFPEDVLFGGGLGWVIAQWVLTWQWPITVGRRIFRVRDS